MEWGWNARWVWTSKGRNCGEDIVWTGWEDEGGWERL